MKVILKVDVPKVGRKSQIVNVADGYAINFLIKKNLAVIADDFHLDQLKSEQARLAKEEEERINAAKALAKKMENWQIEIGAKKGKDGQMFGSVSNKQIEQELHRHGFNIDKRKIDSKGITYFGTSKIKIEIYKGIYTNILVKVVEL